jgi:hypothetical protein
MNQGQVHMGWQRGLAGHGFYGLANLFSAFLSADGRLSLAQSVNTPNFASEIPTEPLHHLYEDPSQLIVATHSSDILKGLLDAGGSPVRVVRVQRVACQTIVAELRPDLVREVWRDPLLRSLGYSTAFSTKGSLFVKATAIAASMVR